HGRTRSRGAATGAGAPAALDSREQQARAGTEGVADMTSSDKPTRVQFEVPAIVPADPQANVTDLLVERVKETPNRPLFAIPDGDGWRDVSAADFEKQVIALAKGYAAAGI